MQIRNINARMRTAMAGAAVVLIGAACGPAEDRIDEWDNDDDRTEAVSANVAMQVAAVRSSVDQTLAELRTEVDEFTSGARDERLERWTEVSTRVEETRGEVLREVDGADVSDPEEARQVRDRAAERIAELEAEVARAEVELAENAGVLQQRAEERIAELEENLAELMRIENEWAETTDQAGSELHDLREELTEARQMASAQGADRDFDELREDLGDALSDLTRDIRHHWYVHRWSENER